MNEFTCFESVFKNEIIDFIKYKRLCGYEYNKRECEKLRGLDIFFEKQKLREKEITIDIIEKWLNDNPNISTTTKSLKYSVITNFSKFLLMKGYKNIFIIPENPYHYNKPFIPYIYSKEEINKVFKILQEGKKNKKGLFMYTGISVLYCCGLRVGELINLRIKDFNYKNNTLTIENGKNNVSRLIPISQKLSEILNDYISNNVYTSTTDFIFYNKLGRRYICAIIRNNFKETIIQSKIQNIQKAKTFRLHDLRHTFAVHTLDNMLKKGIELYQCLPPLSAYLGHKSIYETEYYLRLIESHYAELTDKVFNYTQKIYKVKDKIYNGE